MSVLRDIARRQDIEEEIDWGVIHEIVRAKDGLARESGKTASGGKGVNDSGFLARFETEPAALH
jgi:hypothetical protein